MTTELATTDQGAILERVMMQGDLSKLTPADRVLYYRRVCESLGLNPLTRPFDYISLNNKLTLYAKRDAADQLRSINGVSLSTPEIQFTEGLCIVTVNATSESGRRDADIGAVSIEGLKGEARANAIMKAITKAKRRVTLSICGLGFLDETELASIPNAQPIHVNTTTGEIVNPQPEQVEQPPLTPNQLKRAALQRLEATDGWWANPTDPPSVYEAFSNLLGRDVASLKGLTADDVDTARIELEERNKHRRRFFALGGIQEQDSGRQQLAKMLNVEVPSRRYLTSSQWQTAVDMLEAERLAPADHADPFDD